METIQFKTNINCDGSVEKETAKFSKEKGVKSWNVDTFNPNKILTIETEVLTSAQIIELVKIVGFKAEKV